MKALRVTSNKKGIVLIMVMMFLVTAAIMSLGVYSAAYFVGKTQGIDEVKRIRGYYAACAGLSYANVIINGTTSYPVTRSLSSDYPTVWSDLGLKGSEDVVITITERSGGGYDVTSTFTF